MRSCVLILCVLLTACNTPGFGFSGIAPVRVTVGQSRFDVRVDGARAQAIRVNPEWAPRFTSVAARGAAAMAEVSGCRVARIRGDQAVMLADLDCGPDARLLPAGHAYDCERDHVYGRATELTCTPRL